MRRIAIPLLLAAFALAACGEKTIKPDGAAKSVTDLVSGKAGFTPTDVKCPSGVEAKEDETLECTFTGPDGDYIAKLQVLTVDGERVQFQIDTRRSGG
jgi:hypothetical protein